MALLARISNWFIESPDEPANAERTRGVDPESAFEDLRAAIEPARRRLVDHPLYTAVDSLPRLRQFMGTHVFPVWDFMCLAKRLQRDLTSLETLWRPPQHPDLARFINGVIVGEESDTGPDGEAISHCELYIEAMEDVGANTKYIRKFLDLVVKGVDAEVALTRADVPRAARVFVRNTLDTVTTGTTVEVLSSFVFGREDLIPEMFQRLLPRWETARSATRFAYYVKRHIELDGDDHGPAARRALMTLAGNDPALWAAAQRSAERAIAARIALWDRVHVQLQ